jgi:CRISPR-associated protein Cas1
MAWRGLHLTRPSRLSYADGQIVVAQDDGEVRLALEDVAWVVLDSPRSTLTGSLLSACMTAGIALVVTDETHTPSGVALPFHRHHRQAGVVRIQIEASAPLKKRLWQAVIQAKIENQAAALDAVGAGGGRTLREMARRVGSGDPNNTEAQAARYYWGQFWPRFRRDDDGDRRNKMLNYGYAIIRSGIARAVVACGLLPALGLKHTSISNAFNLADDLVEPLRPFVDVVVWKTVGNGAPCREDLSLEDRRAMAGVLLAEARLGEETLTLLSASERVAESVVRCLEGGTPSLVELPAFAP